MSQDEPSLCVAWSCVKRFELKTLIAVESRMHFRWFDLIQLIIIGVSDLSRLILNNLNYYFIVICI